MKFLLTSEEELKYAKKRSLEGPYNTAGDVSTNSPGDWRRIVDNANKFVVNPLQEFWTPDPAITTCVLPGSKAPLKEGMILKDAAFLYLLSEKDEYLRAVQELLLKQAREPLTNFSNAGTWCDGKLKDQNPSFEIAEWLLRLLIGYDFVKHTFSYFQQQEIKTFFLNAAYFWKRNIEGILNTRFRDRINGDYSFKHPSYGLMSGQTTHLGGFEIPNAAKHFNNRIGSQNHFATLAGVLFNEKPLIDAGKLLFKEWLRFSVFHDGTMAEFERGTEKLPDQGWAYSTVLASQMAEIADVLARTGDYELYDYFTVEGFSGTEGGPKSIKLVVDRLLSFVNGETVRYTMKEDAAHMIDTVTEANQWFAVNDVWFAQNNLFWKDTKINQIYTRTIEGARQYPVKVATSGVGGLQSWSGNANHIPGKLFMYGRLEGQVNPYPPVSVEDNTEEIVTQFSRAAENLNEATENLNAAIQIFALLKERLDGVNIVRVIHHD